MSTVTKIKGVIDNNSLPVITPEGLLPYWEGMFVNRLAEQDYTMTNSQKAAVRAFLNAVAEEDCINNIRSFWPFIGNRENIKAAKVPLIGDKLFDFNDEIFTNIEYNAQDGIVGITSTPAVSTLNAMDFCDEHCINIGTSLIKPATSPISEGAMIKSIGTQNNGAQYRSLQLSANYGNTTFGVYCRTENNPNGIYTYSFSVTENIHDAGNLYSIFGFNDKSVTPYYNRMCNMNGMERYTGALDINQTYLPPTEAAAAGTLTESIYAINCTVTGLIVFNKILTKNKLKIVTDAWKQMNISLGKEVII